LVDAVAMILRPAHASLPSFIAAVVVLALLAFAATAPPQAQAASACEKWGKTNPAHLSNGQARKAILCLVNQKRARSGVGKLDRNRALQKAAQRHNRRMHGTGCFSHQCSGEAALDRRLKSVGYLSGGLSRWGYGENIGWGMRNDGTPKAMVKAWMKSPGHRANILSDSFEHIGVGFDNGTPQSKRDPGGIYTTDFGLRQG
jgi:uncharacterized protein YkwD